MFLPLDRMTIRSGAARRCCRAIVLAIMSLAVISGIASAQNDVAAILGSAALRARLSSSKDLNPDFRCIVYLVFNHETLEWTVYRSRPEGKPTPEGSAPLGPDGNPRVVRSRDERLVLLVANTNPFLYSYEGSVSPPQYSPDAAAMQAALSSIGSANLFLAAPETTIDRARQESRTQTTLCKAICDLNKLSSERELVQSYVQRLETASEIVVPPNLDEVSKVAREALEALKTFESNAGVTLAKPRSCYRIWGPLMRLTVLSSLNEEDMKAARAEMLKMDAQGDCRCKQEVETAFCTLEELEGTFPKGPATSSPGSQQQPPNVGEQRKILNRIQQDVTRVIALISDKALSARKDFLAAAAQLEAFVHLAKTRALIPEANPTSPLVERVAVVTPPFPSQTWLQDNPGTLSIKSDTSIYPDCPRLKPTGIDKKFLLVSHREPFLGFGFGVTGFKKIVDPTFGARYNDPHNPQSQLQITRTAEESHWGTIVAMVFLRARPFLCSNAEPKPFEPGMEFGFGLNSLKKTALFLGASFEFHRFVRLGIGTMCQVITKLADGLTEGADVAAITDVCTQSKLKWRLYVGLTFALDALPLFSSSK